MEIEPKVDNSHGAGIVGVQLRALPAVALAKAGVRVHRYAGPDISGQLFVKTMPTVLAVFVGHRSTSTTEGRSLALPTEAMRRLGEG